MCSRRDQIDAAATTSFDLRWGPLCVTPAVVDETEWRLLPQAGATAPMERKIVATRWRAFTPTTRDTCAQTTGDGHVVKIVMRNMNMRLSVAGHTVQDGPATPGMIHVTEPDAPVRCLFRGPYDVLHLHVPTTLITECADQVLGRQTAVLRYAAVPTKDHVVERLARALLVANQMGELFGRFYADCVGVAIVTRLLSSAHAAEPTRATELQRWRLKRALDYVEAHLAEPIHLADVASASGLTQMHFAAQFRAATGQSPYEYLLRRRIERAQEMLMGTGMPVADVALSVGFQNQSHFTAVFKRFVGQPPQAWRRMRGLEMLPACVDRCSPLRARPD